MGSTIQSRHNEYIAQVKRAKMLKDARIKALNAPKPERVVHLKGNAVTTDARLDRVQEFDERSRGFAIRTTVGSKTRRSYTWRCHDQLDQGPDGACVGFAVAHELIARPAEVQGLDAKYAKEQIYWEAQKIDPWDGGSYSGANPFYEGTSVLAGAKIAKKLGWIEEYRWAFGLEDLILGVGHNGPAVIGVAWYTGMFNPNSIGYIHPTGQVAGGHCVLVNAVNVKKKRFTIHNSWGPAWGMNGECYITFDAMGKLLQERGEACFFLHRHNLPQPD
jgi:hypothetical protein